MAEPKTNEASTAAEPIVIEPPITVRDLAEELGLRATELIGELIKMGVMASINDRLDYATAQSAAEKFNKQVTQPAQAKRGPSKAKIAGGLPRPPVVAVMGHVDHGKTSLLDKIRQTKVADKEAGGITQHLRAHQVKYQDKLITFLDTPGHEAFSILREHGAHLTDIALIVVAADDGLKPQTVEAIKFAQAAGVKIVVAITKVDKPGIDLNRIKQQLAEHNLNPEDWGGDTVMIETSAKTGEGLDKLLEIILLIAEVEELGAPDSGPASGTVIETHIAKGRGAQATLLVEAGELKNNDFVVCGEVYGKLRRLEDTEGKPLPAAGPSTPVVATGWKEMPALGQRFKVVGSEAEAKKSLREEDATAGTVATASSPQDNSPQQTVNSHKSKHLPIVIKADAHGSLEALHKSLGQINLEEAQVKIVSQSLGDISESDISLAESVGAQVVGFSVLVPVKIKQLAQSRGVNLKIYTVIYELLDDIRTQLEAMIEPKFVETKMAELEIKGVFKVTAGNLICGGLVKEGKINAGLKVKKPGDEDGVNLGEVVSVQREQQDAKEVSEGQMCGLNIKTAKKTPVQIGDVLEFYKLIEQKK